VLVPLFGALSDRIGRKPIIIGTTVLYLGLAYPLFSWVHENFSFGNLVIMQTVLCSVLGAWLPCINGAAGLPPSPGGPWVGPLGDPMQRCLLKGKLAV
jgi:MFS family permease